MNLKNLFIAGAVIATTFAFAEEKKFEIPNNTAPGKICLLVTDVGTIDTVAGTEEFLAKIKKFNIDEMPSLSAADKAANPNVASQEVVVRFNDQYRQYNEQQREIARQNRRMEAILDQLRTSIQGDKNKRDIIVAKNYLQSYLTSYNQFIQVIDRANTNLSEVEKAINGNDQQDIASAVVFLTVIMQDMKEESSTVNVHGTDIKKTVYTQKAVGNLRDFNGNVLTAFNVVAQTSKRQTSSSKVQGFNPSSDLMEDVLKQIADKIAAYYITALDIECIGPKNDDDFDEDEVTITVDGKDFDSGDNLLAGKHVVCAELDGYKTVVKNINLKNGKANKTLKIKFKKEQPATPAESSETESE